MMQRLSADQEKSYKVLLSDIGALSRLFSENDKPFIHSRTAEYLYCKIYDAENLSRSDITIDAKDSKRGIGVKTFVYSGKPTYQKIAEFNRAIKRHGHITGIDKIKLVAALRNERMDFVETTYGISQFFYHCVVRDDNKILVFEEEMVKIDLENIKIIKENDSSIRFTDGIHNYSFSISKSTLLKEFFPTKRIFEIPIKILDDPFSLVSKLSVDIGKSKEYVPQERVVLPMYSYKNKKPFVYPRSGLNLWNAGGRARNFNEVYLSIPLPVREKFPDFFPDRDTPFELNLPDGSVLDVKVSQDGGKALMSNPNSVLGEWLLREVLRLDDGDALTYEKLIDIGVDSVEIFKKSGKYYANFLPLNSYEEFVND